MGCNSGGNNNTDGGKKDPPPTEPNISNNPNTTDDSNPVDKPTTTDDSPRNDCEAKEWVTTGLDQKNTAIEKALLFSKLNQDKIKKTDLKYFSREFEWCFSKLINQK